MVSTRVTSLRRATGSVAGPTTARASCRLSLLGGFELARGHDVLQLPPNGQRVLAFLALQGRPLHRAYVAGRLWMELTQERAHGCLRTSLWRLRRLPCPVVATTSTHVALPPSVGVDVRELEACAEHVLHRETLPPGAIEHLSHARDLLPDWYDDWLPQERERLRLTRLLALEALGERLIGAHRFPEASIAALAALSADPLRETSCRLLIRSQLGVGNRAEAIRQYELLRTQLTQRLGLEPSPQTEQLVRGLI